MRRVVRLVLYITYLYSFLLGVLTLTINLDTRRAKRSLFYVLYSISMNICMIALVPSLYFFNVLQLITERVRDLHGVIFLLIISVKAAGILLSIYNKWLKRDAFRRLLNDIKNLQQMYFRVLKRNPQQRTLRKMYERNVIMKYVFNICTELTFVLAFMLKFRHVWSWKLLLVNFVLAVLTSTVYVITNHFYFALCYINRQFGVLQVELLLIINATDHLYNGYSQRITTLEIANNLDALAFAHFKLQLITERIAQLYAVQGLAVYLNAYLHNTAIIYFIYCHLSLNTSFVEWTEPDIVLIGISICFYYMDLAQFGLIKTQLLDIYKHSADILKEIMGLYILDADFRQSFEQFMLQMKQRPLQFDLLGLFVFNKAKVFTSIASILSNAIFLVQYDYNNLSAVLK